MKKWTLCLASFVLLALPVVAQAGGALDETGWEWLVRMLIEAAGGFWQW
jgi:hypothetical protein